MVGRRAVTGLVGGFALVLAACGPGASASSETASRSGASVGASQTAGGEAGGAGATGSGTPSAASTGPEPATVTLALAGDANTAWTAKRVLRTGVGPMSTYLQQADVAMVTLETLVVADRTGLVAEKKNFTFVTGPALLDRLHDAGVDVVNGANNHTMDYKVEGMRRMLALDSPVPIVGIGADPEAASTPWRTTVRGRHVVVFGANDVETDGLDWGAQPGRPGQLVVARPAGQQLLLDRIRAERAKDADAVIVAFLHWGLEPQTCQNDRQEELAREIAAAGADVVAGSHTHRQEPVVTILGANGRTTVVAYGLGNFVFNRSSPDAGHTGVLDVTVPGRGTPTLAWHPALIVDGIPRPLEGRAEKAAQEAWRTHADRCP